MPNSKVCLLVKQGVLTLLPSPRCVTPEYDKDRHRQYLWRTLKDVMPISTAFHCQKVIMYAQDMAERVSMHIVNPVFSDFLFAGPDFHSKCYSVFCFEPMHKICLGISNTLKECALKGLCDQSPFTGQVSVNDVRKPFPSGWSRIILFLYNFLKFLDAHSNTFKY